MNTSTSLQALAVLAVGSALLFSATPADAARGGFRPAPARVAPVRAPVSFNRAPARMTSGGPMLHHVAPTRGVQPAPNSVRRSNARDLFGDLGKVGGAVLKEGKTVG